MNEDWKSPEITEPDVLRGSFDLELEKLDGTRIVLQVKRLTWAASLAISSEGDPSQALIKTVLMSLPKENATDEFLNQLTPPSLMAVHNVAMQLSMGVTALKKFQAARKAGQPFTQISVPPVPNSAPEVIPATS